MYYVQDCPWEEYHFGVLFRGEIRRPIQKQGQGGLKRGQSLRHLGPLWLSTWDRESRNLARWSILALHKLISFANQAPFVFSHNCTHLHTQSQLVARQKNAPAFFCTEMIHYDPSQTPLFWVQSNRIAMITCKTHLPWFNLEKFSALAWNSPTW